MSNMLKPLVSIFIPVYNAEKFIVECIESCLSQTYDNIELVISDDASKDNSWRLISEYSEKYPQKVRAFRQIENLGVTKNCDLLLRQCQGEYICFLAGDDLLGPRCVESSLNYFSEFQDLGIVFHKFQRVDENSILIPEENNLEPHFGDIKDFLRKGIYLMANGMVVKRAANPQLAYNLDLKYASDHEFIFSILEYNDSRFYYTHEIHAFWRLNPKSITNTNQLETFIDAFLSNYELSKKYRDHTHFINIQLINYLYYLRKYRVISSYSYQFYKVVFSIKNKFIGSLLSFYKEKLISHLVQFNNKRLVS